MKTEATKNADSPPTEKREPSLLEAARTGFTMDHILDAVRAAAKDEAKKRAPKKGRKR